MTVCFPWPFPALFHGGAPALGPAFSALSVNREVPYLMWRRKMASCPHESKGKRRSAPQRPVL
jgi:hypothetical protein